MTDTDRIAQMAREAGMIVNDDWVQGTFLDDLAAFARIVAEDCAKVCECTPDGKERAAHAIRSRYSKP